MGDLFCLDTNCNVISTFVDDSRCFVLFWRGDWILVLGSFETVDGICFFLGYFFMVLVVL